MTIPSSTNPPDDPERQARTAASVSRRRRARRQLVPMDAEGRAALTAALARRAYPNYEFFLFSILSGAVLGLGFLLDQPPVLLFGILLAPLMAPWVGMLLALITGSVRFFVETLVATLIAAVLVFLTGLLSGFAARAFGPLTFNNAFFHTQMWLAWLVVLAAGSALLVISFVRSEEKPFLPSVILAYSLFAPVSATGFGLASGVEGDWWKGLLVFAIHLGVATLTGLVTLLALKFRLTTAGAALSGVSVMAVLALLGILIAGPVLAGQQQDAEALPTATLTLEPSPELVLAVESPSPTMRATTTPRVQTATIAASETSGPSPVPLTLSVTLPASETPTVTLTIEPTPVLARISSDTGGGVNLRKTPNGTYIATLDNGSTVEVLPELQEASGVIWAHVFAMRNGVRLEGWILQSVLMMATPVPNWQPSATPTAENTPLP